MIPSEKCPVKFFYYLFYTPLIVGLFYIFPYLVFLTSFIRRAFSLTRLAFFLLLMNTDIFLRAAEGIYYDVMAVFFMIER